MHAITISKSISTAVRPSRRVLETAAMFGLGVDDQREIAIVPTCEIPLPHTRGRGGIIFITGPSGSGKSTILKLIAQQCRALSMTVHDLDDLPSGGLPDAPLVDALDWHGATLQQVMGLLSLVGLSDAFVMLRRPCELSDGQRARARLGQLIAQTMRGDAETHGRSAVLVADEFGSTLDRLTAKTIARNLRRWIDRQATVPHTFIAATTHDDLLEALEPEVLVWKGLGDQIEVVVR